ncbi:MAG TPA: flagellar biosynthesis protein FlhF [Lachnospiraceae bacterium]|nr:flagellar biosynthesis protein FlhF [Lachnospiraceae bacterium]
MIIKKFVGKTEEEAVAAARKELGDSVVIMNVKAVERKGLRAIFRARQTEVTVALEEENDTLKTVRREQASAPVKKEPVPVPLKKLSAGNGAPSEDFSYENALDPEDRISIEKKLDNLQSLLMTRFQQSEAERENTAGRKVNSDSEGGSEEEKQEETGPEEITEQQRFLRLLYNTMLESEVDEKYANQIVNDVDVSGQSNLPIDYILENIYQKMILKFGRAQGIVSAEGGPKIVIFMGPTGVGKTTTIAKIASSYAVEEKKKVALLTADTYRIAAVEQLRTYANILEVPFRVIYSEGEVREAVREFVSYDYIFVDTMGHSHKNEEQLGHMKKLYEALQETGDCQTFLVLSATTKYRDLLKIVSTYEDVADFQLIFTKLDETAAMGNLLNMKMFTGKPVAFVTNGQNVPSDIEQFNPQKTVKQILSIKQEKS